METILTVAKDETLAVNKDRASFWYGWAIWGVAVIFYLYEYALRASPSTMANELMSDFGITAGTLGLFTSFYYWAYVPLQVPCGVIVDWLGPRKLITFSSLLCVAGTFLFAESSTIWVAIIGRFLIGAGSACAFLSCAKIGAEWLPSKYFALVTSLGMLMGTVGGSCGGHPVAMLMSTYGGWRKAMVIAAIIGVGVTVAAWLIIRDRPKGAKNNNYAITQELGILAGLKSIVVTPQIWLVGVYGLLMYVPLTGFAEIWAGPYLMETYGINNSQASLGQAMVFVGMGIGCPISVFIADYWQSYRKVMAYSALASMLFFLLAIYLPNKPWPLMLGLLFLGGFFDGGQILYFASAKAFSPPHASGTSVGFVNGLLMSSGIIFPPLLGFLLDYAWDGQITAEGARYYSPEVYQWSMMAIPFSLFLAWVMMFFVRETYPKEDA